MTIEERSRRSARADSYEQNFHVLGGYIFRGCALVGLSIIVAAVVIAVWG